MTASSSQLSDAKHSDPQAGMQVKITSSKQLRRVLSIQVPIEEVRQAYDEVYNRLKKNMRVPGFRPGHFPKEMAEKRFREVMSRESLETLAPKYFQAAIKKLDIKIATRPQFSKLDIDIKKPLSFEVEFEVMPEFQLLPPKSFKLAKVPVIKIDSKEVEARVQKLRREKGQLESKNEAAAKNDVVTFGFQGLLDGKPFSGGSAENQRMEIGGEGYLPDFQAQFEGVTKGQEKVFPLTFPDDYHVSELAGKQVEFTIQVKDVQQVVSAKEDKTFWKLFGDFQDAKAFRQHVNEIMERQKHHELHHQQIGLLAEQIQEKYQFDVPERLMQEGRARFEKEIKSREASLDAKTLKKRLAEEEKRLRDGLRLNYVLEALAKTHNIKVDPAELRQRFNMQAMLMRKDAGELLNSSLGKHIIQDIHDNILYEQSLGHLSALVLGETPPRTATATDAVQQQPEKT